VELIRLQALHGLDAVQEGKHMDGCMRVGIVDDRACQYSTVKPELLVVVINRVSPCLIGTIEGYHGLTVQAPISLAECMISPLCILTSR
jgi:hypothetical protein